MKKILILIFLMAVMSASVNAQIPVATMPNDTTVCAGENLTITFTGTPPFEIRYGFGPNPGHTLLSGISGYSVSIPAPTSSGIWTFNLLAFNANGSPGNVINNNAQITVKDFPPKPAIMSMQDACYEGEPFVLRTTATGYDEYHWNDPSNGYYKTDNADTLKLNFASEFRFVLRVRDGACWSEWSDTSRFEIKMQPFAQYLTTPDNSVCDGELLTFSIPEYPLAMRYEWVESTMGLGTVQSSAYGRTHTAVGTYTYKMRVQNVEGCWSEYSNEVSGTIHALPQKPVITISNVCLNGTPAFTADTGFVQYEWYERLSGATTFSSVPSLILTTAGTYTYRVRVQDANGCWSEWSEYVTFDAYDLPVKQVIDPVSDVCFGNTLTFTTSTPGFVRYRWQETGSNTVTNTAVPSLDVTAEGSYTYRLRVQDGNGCWSISSDAVTANVNQNPVKPVIDQPADVCFGDTLTFETTAGYPRYRWRISGTAVTGTSNTVFETAVGAYTYQVRVRNAELCWSEWSDAVTANVNPNPVKPVITLANASLCLGDTLTFTADTGFVRYEWTETGSGAVTTIASNEISQTALGTYYYKVRVQDANNCWSDYSDDVRGEVYTSIITPAINQVNNVCFGAALTFETPATGFDAYEWTETGSGTVTTTTVNTISQTAAGTYTYKVRLMDDGCWSDYSAEMSGEIYPAPNKPVIDPVADVCLGDKLTFTTTSGLVRYRWQETGSGTVITGTNSTIEEYAPGTYTYRVRVQNTYNCWSVWSDAVTATVNAISSASVAIDPVTDVCFGENLTFTAPAGFVLYVWTAGDGTVDTSTNNTKSVTSAGVHYYRVKVQDANGCWSDYSAVASGEVYDIPVKPVIDPVTDVCFGDTLTLETTPGLARYRWRETTSLTLTNTTVNTLSLTATGAYAYQVRVRDAHNCWSEWSDIVNVKINDLPAKPSILPVSNVCSGAALTFTATAGFAQYEWTETVSGTVTPTATNEISQTLTGTYTYKVRVQDANGCWSDYSDEASGEVYALPAKPVVNPVSDVCFEETLTFETAPGFVQYRWQETGSGATVTSTDNTISQTATGTYSYRVRVQDGNGCWSPWSDAVSATVNPKPETPVIGRVSNVCFGETIKFEAIPSTYTVYEWTETISGTVDTSGSIKEVSATGVYNYKVRIRNAEGCWSDYSDPVSGEIYPVPGKPVINPVSDVCFEETLTFETAPGFVQYRWQETGSGATVTVTDNTISQTATGTYSYRVRVQNTDGCWSPWSDAVSATVNPKPEKPVINPVEDVCFGETLTFETAAGYPRYRWRINGVTAAGANNTVSVTAVGTYTYQVRVQNVEGCWSDYSDAVTATVKPKPDAPGIENVDVCFGDTLIFETEAGYPRYRWQETISGDIHNGTENTISQTATGKYIYRVQVRNVEGCWSDWSNAATGYVHPLPERPSIEPAGTVAICEDGSITLTATSGLAKYIWYLNGTEISSGISNTYTATQAGNYTVKVETVYGCESDISDATTVEVIPYPAKPLITAAGMEDGLVWRKTGMGIVFEVVNRLDTLVYQWYHNGSVISGGQGEALHLTGLRLTDAGLYSVTATTQKAQCSTLSDNVELIMREDVYIHNLITPNNDGHNDNLHIRGLEIYPHNELTVINRWGNQVFTAKDYVNGTWNGANLPDGVYFYKLKLIEFNGYTEEKTGYFHLKR
jgi:gliding motility-associated-like protein